MRQVCIVGVGVTPMGEIWRKSLRQLFTDAALDAIKAAGVDHVDSLYVGCMSSGLFVHQEHLGALMADYIGMPGLPAARVESACASGGVAVRPPFSRVSGYTWFLEVGAIPRIRQVFWLPSPPSRLPVPGSRNSGPWMLKGGVLTAASGRLGHSGGPASDLHGVPD